MLAEFALPVVVNALRVDRLILGCCPHTLWRDERGDLAPHEWDGEARMHCGLGKCGRCNLGEKLVCVDGPVFSMAEIGGMLESYL